MIEFFKAPLNTNAPYFALTPVEAKILPWGRTASVMTCSMTIPCFLTFFVVVVDIALMLLGTRIFKASMTTRIRQIALSQVLAELHLRAWVCLDVSRKCALKQGLETHTSWLKCDVGHWGRWEIWTGLETAVKATMLIGSSRGTYWIISWARGSPCLPQLRRPQRPEQFRQQFWIENPH